jgi:uncharacterized membrane protein
MDYILWGRPLYETVILIFIYSFLGWIGEVLYAYYKRGHFVNRGFLYGPFCPIYGVCITAIVTMLKPLEGNIWMLFLCSIGITTVVEYITSVILEKIFDSKWWDYSKNKFNVKGRICLSFSLLWGLAGLVMYMIVNPRVLRLIYMMPQRWAIFISYIVVLIFFVDIVMTVISLAGLRKYVVKFQELALKAKGLTGSRLDRIIKMKEFLEAYGEFELKLKFNQRRLLKSFPDFKKDRFLKLINELKNEIDKFREDPLNRR